MLKKIRDILIIILTSTLFIAILVIGIGIFNNRSMIFKYTQQLIDNNAESINKLDEIQTNIQANNTSELLNDDLSNKSIRVTINGISDILNLSNATITISPKKLMTEHTNTIQFDLPEGAILNLFGQSITSENNALEIDVEKIDRDFTYEGDLTYNGCVRKVVFETLPEYIAEYTLINSLYNDYGHFYLSDFSTNYALEMDGKGNVVFYLYDEGAEMHDFKKIKADDGNTYYSYYKDYRFVLLDENYNFIKEIGLTETPKLGAVKDIDCHDIILYNPDHYYIFSYLPRNLGELGTDTPDYLALATYIQEVKDGEVIFEWDSSDYPRFKEGALNNQTNIVDGVGSKKANDYMHINSIFIDPKDGNIIISLRHQSAIVKISRETGEVIWTLGGKFDDFGITDDQTFFYQHTATYLSDGSLMIFNNGNDKQRSNVLRFFLDENNHKVTDFIKYDFGDRFSLACGSAFQMDENHIIVGWGYKQEGLIAASIINMDTGLVENEIKTDRVITGYRVHYSAD